jgi:5-methylcytosine-specific restriction endonuclease McrA
MFVATLDHVVPLSLGGRTNESNLVTCCWSCNYGKANYTVEQIGIDNPLDRAVDLDLENKVERLLKIALAKPKASPNSV